MASFNKVILIGNLVSDPELKTTPNGVNVVSFRIAVNRRYAKPTDAQQTDFIDIVAWRSTAEFVCKYFAKGKPILICGSIQSRNWEDKEGKKRTTFEVIADEVSFVERRSSQDGNYDNNQSQFTTPAASAPKFEELSSDDDLPF